MTYKEEYIVTIDFSIVFFFSKNKYPTLRFKITPTLQRACALAVMSTFFPVYLFFVTPVPTLKETTGACQAIKKEHCLLEFECSWSKSEHSVT